MTGAERQWLGSERGAVGGARMPLSPGSPSSQGPAQSGLGAACPSAATSYGTLVSSGVPTGGEGKSTQVMATEWGTQGTPDWPPGLEGLCPGRRPPLP